MNVDNRALSKVLPAFYGEVIFFSKCRKTMPADGYRPHIVLQKDGKKNYLGIFFTGFSGTENLDEPCVVKINAMYEGVDYSGIALGDLFWVMEGANVVAEGRILESLA